MVRLTRMSPTGIPVHVIQRGNNCQACFVSEDDYRAYVGWLKEYARKYSVVEVHAWEERSACWMEERKKIILL